MPYPRSMIPRSDEAWDDYLQQIRAESVTFGTTGKRGRPQGWLCWERP